MSRDMKTNIWVHLCIERVVSKIDMKKILGISALEWMSFPVFILNAF
jgi:hypothetical protein